MFFYKVELDGWSECETYIFQNEKAFSYDEVYEIFMRIKKEVKEERGHLDYSLFFSKLRQQGFFEIESVDITINIRM